MTLSESVCKFIENGKLFSPSSILICGVSGGKDSMAMLHVLHSANYNIVVAHVNYRLRKENSDKDQALVEDYCTKNRIMCESHVVDNEEFMTLLNGNLQEKARAIRNDWFHLVKSKYKADYICLAHHAEDVAETFLMNAFRSSGMRGLQTIKPKSYDFRRPLLKSTLAEITDYIHLNQIDYRLDESNLSSKYDRNYLRLNVFPLIEERWPKAQENLATSSNHISKDYELLSHYVFLERKKWIQSTDSHDKLGPIHELRILPHAKTLVFHLLRDYNFSPEVILDMIFKSHQSGKIFESHSHRGITDRNQILIQKNTIANTFEVKIDHATSVTTATGTIIFRESYDLNKISDKRNETFDAEQVLWPLTIRNWNQGDKIAPLGLNGNHKKLSDIFINKKFDHISKSQQIVVCDASGEIIWIPGLMISEKIKYDSETTKLLIAEWHPN